MRSDRSRARGDEATLAPRGGGFGSKGPTPRREGRGGRDRARRPFGGRARGRGFQRRRRRGADDGTAMTGARGATTVERPFGARPLRRLATRPAAAGLRARSHRRGGLLDGRSASGPPCHPGSAKSPPHRSERRRADPEVRARSRAVPLHDPRPALGMPEPPNAGTCRRGQGRGSTGTARSDPERTVETIAREEGAPCTRHPPRERTEGARVIVATERLGTLRGL